VVGDVDQVLACGHLQGHNDFSDPDLHGIAINDETGAEAIRRRMNTDGMTIIDGLTGIVHVNHFFSNYPPPSSLARFLSKDKGGSRTGAALWLSRTCSQCVVFKISKDGSVTECQSGHCVQVDHTAAQQNCYCEYGY
jgi:hypothetical protein